MEYQDNALQYSIVLTMCPLDNNTGPLLRLSMYKPKKDNFSVLWVSLPEPELLFCIVNVYPHFFSDGMRHVICLSHILSVLRVVLSAELHCTYF